MNRVPIACPELVEGSRRFYETWEGPPRKGAGHSPSYQPLVCSICASSNPDTANPFIAPTRSSLTSNNTFGS
jgi:hypothetical protein